MTVSHATSTGNFNRPALVLLSGLPGAGKTTFALLLAERTGAAVVESDAVRHEIAVRPNYTRAESRSVFETVEVRARESLLTGSDVIIDATNLTRHDRARFVRLTRNVRARLVIVRLVAPYEILVERLEGPRAGSSEAGPGVLALMQSRPQAIAQPHVVVDTSFDIEPALSAVARMLGQ